MRILILSQWYPPEPQKLISDLAESLQSLGHQIEVLTGFPNYPSGELYPGYRLRMWQREVMNGVPVTRVPLFPDHSRSSLKRVVNYASFALAAALLGPWLVKRPDVIFVVHPPLTVGFPAWVLSRTLKAPFVLNIQDLWPETLADTGMLDNPTILSLVGSAAKAIYARASKIIVISNGFRQNLIEKGVEPSVLHVISNWVDVEHYQPLVADESLGRELSLAGRFNVMFAGVVGRAQGLDNILAAARLLADLPSVQFVIVGDGIELPRLKTAAHAMGLSNVIFLGRYPTAKMPSLFALADVLLVHLRNTSLFRITIPHKIFSYMASGKPVLAAVEGDAREVVQSAGAGLVCAPDNPEALAETVREFVLMSPDSRRSMGQRGREATCGLYTRQRLISEIAKVLSTSASEN